MKKLLIFIVTLFFVMGCNWVPTINEVTEGTLEPVEELLTEDNNSKRYVRLDRYFLNEQVDKLTYKGTLKATVFYEKESYKRFGQYNYRWVTELDSLKIYRTVTITFMDKKYEQYTISIQ